MNVPQHTVIVPDGNRRWAKKKGKPSFFGHIQGAKAAERILKTALDLKLPYVTLWGSSVANVTERSPAEIRALLNIFRNYFERLGERKDIHTHRVRVRILGRWESLFPEPVKKPMRALIEKTRSYAGHHLTFLMAYDGTEEMVEAVKKIVRAKSRNPKLAVTAETVKDALWSRELPPVDLVIRTGGEPHWSAGLMMWDVADARLHFTETLWPDFGEEEFTRIVAGYGTTERRFGK